MRSTRYLLKTKTSRLIQLKLSRLLILLILRKIT